MVFSHPVALDPDIFNNIRKRKAVGRAVSAGNPLASKARGGRNRLFATYFAEKFAPALEAKAKPMEIDMRPACGLRKPLHIFYAPR